MNRNLFGTSGIRGDAEELFTNQFCYDIGRTFAIFLSNKKAYGAVAIGMDPRGSSPRIVKAIESGLLAEGREVFDEGATPVPSMNNILLTGSKYAGSIMVSGSHIEPKLNGVKFFSNKEEILKEHEKEIEKIFYGLKCKKEFREDLSDLHNEAKAREAYQERLLSLSINEYPAWKVVCDPGDGAQSDTIPYVLKELGLEVVELNAIIQGEFFARDTEVPEYFEGLSKKVREEKADFGVGYDSDGDRVVFIDENGNFIPGDFTCTLVARNLPGDIIVTPINTSSVIDHIGKTVKRTKVGSPYVVEEMKKSHAIFGFEGNGGGIFNDMHSRDGGRMTIEVMNIMAKEGTRLSQVISELPRFYIEKTKVSYKWELKDKILSEAKKVFKGEKYEEIDGIKVWIDLKNWILFRSSMNAPEFRVFAESDSRQKARELMEKGINLVRSMIK